MKNDRSSTVMWFRLSLLLVLLFLGGASLQAQEDFGEVDYYKYSNSMTVTGCVRSNGAILGEDAVVAVFCKGELRGKNSPDESGILYLTIYGETSGEKLHVKVYTGGKVVDVSKELEFSNDAIIGSKLTPYYIDLPYAGDVDGDGRVTVADAVALLNYLLQKPSDGFLEENADVNDDGKISLDDVRAIVNIILKK